MKQTTTRAKIHGIMSTDRETSSKCTGLLRCRKRSLTDRKHRQSLCTLVATSQIVLTHLAFFFSPLLSYLSCSHYLSLITEFYHGGLVILASVSFSELLGAGNAAKYTKLIHRSCITDVLSSVYTPSASKNCGLEQGLHRLIQSALVFFFSLLFINTPYSGV